MAMLALLLSYALLAPALFAAVYQVLEPFSRFHELVLFAYFLGLPMGLAVGAVHWLMRARPVWVALMVTVSTGTVLAAVGGPLAIAAALPAYLIVFPLAHWLYQRLSCAPTM